MCRPSSERGICRPKCPARVLVNVETSARKTPSTILSLCDLTVVSPLSSRTKTSEAVIDRGENSMENSTSPLPTPLRPWAVYNTRCGLWRAIDRSNAKNVGCHAPVAILCPIMWRVRHTCATIRGGKTCGCWHPFVRVLIPCPEEHVCAETRPLLSGCFARHLKAAAACWSCLWADGEQLPPARRPRRPQADQRRRQCHAARPPRGPSPLVPSAPRRLFYAPSGPE